MDRVKLKLRQRLLPALLLLAFALLCGWAISSPAMETRSPFAGDHPEIYLYAKNWEIHKGDIPNDSTQWAPFDPQAQSSLQDYEGSLWLRRALPKIEGRDPYLFLNVFKRVEVFIDGNRVYESRMERPSPYVHQTAVLHPIPLAPEYAGKTMMIHAIWSREGWVPHWNAGGDRTSFLLGQLQNDGKLLTFAAIFLMAGALSLGACLKRPEEKTYGWFAALTLCAGFGMAFMMVTPQWYLDMSEVYYWKDLLLPMGILAFIGFYGAVLGDEFRRMYRLLTGAMAVYTAASAAAAATSPSLYMKLLLHWSPYWIAVLFSAVTYTLVKRLKKDRSSQIRWLAGGYAVLLISGLIHILISATLNIYRFAAWPVRLQETLYKALPIGLLAFMFCLAMVLFKRFSDVHQELRRYAEQLAATNEEMARFHHRLEELVAERTRELEEANRSLEGSVRETAEALTEVSVLEERNRIAHEIHDVVGHTLTAAIIQLELARKLADRDAALAFERMDVSGGLVRKGLDEIRRAVRMLKDEGADFDLAAALHELTAETKENAGVTFESRIDPLPHLNGVTRRVLYHAFMEGITNGLRHGRCTHFQFRLQASEGLLTFRLENDGEPYGSAKPGFGLTAMMERVHLLGGTVQIGSGPEEGCLLDITLPYHEV